jgi:hypothetical protein
MPSENQAMMDCKKRKPKILVKTKGREEVTGITR